jgi:hypothetical protein
VLAGLVKDDTKFALKSADNLSLILSIREVYIQRVAESHKIKALEFQLYGDKIDQNV